jgi:hypothetical protein
VKQGMFFNCGDLARHALQVELFQSGDQKAAPPLSRARGPALRRYFVRVCIVFCASVGVGLGIAYTNWFIRFSPIYKYHVIKTGMTVEQVEGLLNTWDYEWTDSINNRGLVCRQYTRIRCFPKTQIVVCFWKQRVGNAELEKEESFDDYVKRIAHKGR